MELRGDQLRLGLGGDYKLNLGTFEEVEARIGYICGINDYEFLGKTISDKYGFKCSVSKYISGKIYYDMGYVLLVDIRKMPKDVSADVFSDFVRFTIKQAFSCIPKTRRVMHAEGYYGPVIDSPVIIFWNIIFVANESGDAIKELMNTPIIQDLKCFGKKDWWKSCGVFIGYDEAMKIANTYYEQVKICSFYNLTQKMLYVQPRCKKIKFITKKYIDFLYRLFKKCIVK